MFGRNAATGAEVFDVTKLKAYSLELLAVVCITITIKLVQARIPSCHIQSPYVLESIDLCASTLYL
jgi:hypothetical protein